MANPYNFTLPVTDPKRFFGHHELVNELVHGLSNQKAYAIYGGRRTGKTSILRMIEYKLEENSVGSMRYKIIPIYLDLELEVFTSPKDFFQVVLDKLQVKLSSGRSKLLEQNLVLTNNYAIKFIRAFINLLECIEPEYQNIKIALLIDGLDKFYKLDWTIEVEEKLRAIVSNSPISGRLGILLAGGVTFLIDSHSNRLTSPLVNVLNKEIIIPMCSRSQMRQLINAPLNTEASIKVSDEIFYQTGGNMFLAQYILSDLWESKIINNMKVEDIERVAKKFITNSRIFKIWNDSIGEKGRHLFSLINNASPKTLEELLTVSADANNLAIKPLLMHGLISGTLDSKRTLKYSSSNLMFQKWFQENSKLMDRDSYLSETFAVASRATPQKPYELRQLRQILLDKFSLSDVRDLCFELSLNFENLGDITLNGAIRELLIRMEQTERVTELINACKKLRPDLEF